MKTISPKLLVRRLLVIAKNLMTKEKKKKKTLRIEPMIRNLIQTRVTANRNPVIIGMNHKMILKSKEVTTKMITDSLLMQMMSSLLMKISTNQTMKKKLSMNLMIMKVMTKSSTEESLIKGNSAQEMTRVLMI
jgi:hypothetical protein